MHNQAKNILVTGATGKQGGAVISALLAAQTSPSAPFHILALTRSATSPSAMRLDQDASVTVIEGDLAKPEAIFAGRDVWGVFSVQANGDEEEGQGQALVDAAVANGVRYFVYSSGDRGGPERSRTDPTFVGNFAAKFAIEKHLEERCRKQQQQQQQGGEQPAAMAYTVLRPVTFFENLTTELHGRGFARMWEQMGGKKLQMVSVRDVGWFAAHAFLEAERGNEGKYAELSVAGDELTQKEAAEIYRAVLGQDMALAPCVIGKAVKFVLKGTVGDMFRWFEEVGYGAAVEECRMLNPEMLDFKGWLEAGGVKATEK